MTPDAGKADKVTIQAIQIETTSRCNLDCQTCLKPAYKQSWLERDMDEKLFSRIVSQIKEEKPAVHLQGWGEPLIQEGFLSFARQLNKENISTSFTTNGTVMTKNLAVAIIESGVDGITFSMAGACASTQDGLRGAGTFALLQKAITTFIAVRKQQQTKKPQIAVSYLLTPETVKELPAAVSWCRRVGVDAFVTVHLTQAGGPVQKNLAFLPSKQEARRYRFLGVRTNACALFANMKLNLKPLYPSLTSVCDKNPHCSLFISANGDVSPCVFLAPPVENGIFWQQDGRRVYQKPLVMGNVNDLTLQEIWENPNYRAFRDKFRQRSEYHDKRLAGVSYSFSGAVELETAIEEIKRNFISHPAPDHCLACAKLQGYYKT